MDRDHEYPKLIDRIVVTRTVLIVAALICIGVAVYEGVMLYLDRNAHEEALSEYDALISETVRMDGTSFFGNRASGGKGRRGLLNFRNAREDAGTETSGEKDAADAPEGKKDADGEEVSSQDTARAGDDVSLEGETYPALIVDYETLSEINPAFAGWLYVPALDLSYPVARERFAGEYLEKTFRGTENSTGAIFTDKESDAAFEGMHDFIFGHNMRNGSMFGCLKMLQEEDASERLDDNPYIYVYREDSIKRYRIFAFYRSEAEGVVYRTVENERSYRQVLNYMLENNLYKGEDLPSKLTPDDDIFEGGPSLLTLSTCTGREGGTKRFLVTGLLELVWEK